jgi:hypothetical protein
MLIYPHATPYIHYLFYVVYANAGAIYGSYYNVFYLL